MQTPEKEQDQTLNAEIVDEREETHVLEEDTTLESGIDLAQTSEERGQSPNLVDEDEDDEDDEDEDDDDEDEDDDEDLESTLKHAHTRIESLVSENDALKTRMLRSQADMENYKRRSEREKGESIKFANKRVFLQLLEVLDNFDRALSVVSDPKDNFVIGVNMIQKQLADVLVQNGVEEINPIGRLFDPHLDEALAQQLSAEHPEHTVVEVFQKGYRFQGSLLRPSKVKVSTLPSGSHAPDDVIDVEPEA